MSFCEVSKLWFVFIAVISASIAFGDTPPTKEDAVRGAISTIQKVHDAGIFIPPPCPKKDQTQPEQLADGGDGGGSSGGGPAGRKNFLDGSAWFLGKDKKIKACFKISPNFGVPASFAKKQIIDAFATWKNYLTEKGEETEYAKSNPRMALALDIQMLSKCDGQEDLKFYFGTEDEKVKAARNEYRPSYDDLYSVAHRSSYDPTSGWGKGFIWISSNNPINRTPGAPSLWGYKSNLFKILLHEIGHALGCEHVENTIMDENVLHFIKSPSVTESADARGKIRAWREPNPIDGTKELIPSCQYGCTSFSYQGTIGTDGLEAGDPGYRAPEKTFKLLTGRQPVGAIRAHFSATAKNSELILSDDKGAIKLRIDIVPSEQKSEFGELPKIFDRVLETKLPKNGSRSQGFYGAGGQTVFGSGTIRSSSGKRYQIQWLQNAAHAYPFKIIYQDRRQAHVLFDMPPYNDEAP